MLISASRYRKGRARGTMLTIVISWNSIIRRAEFSQLVLKCQDPWCAQFHTVAQAPNASSHGGDVVEPFLYRSCRVSGPLAKASDERTYLTSTFVKPQIVLEIASTQRHLTLSTHLIVEFKRYDPHTRRKPQALFDRPSLWFTCPTQNFFGPCLKAGTVTGFGDRHYYSSLLEVVARRLTKIAHGCEATKPRQQCRK